MTPEDIKYAEELKRFYLEDKEDGRPFENEEIPSDDSLLGEGGVYLSP